jgi:hypothetical protein
MTEINYRIKVQVLSDARGFGHEWVDCIAATTPEPGSLYYNIGTGGVDELGLAKPGQWRVISEFDPPG